MTIEVRVTRITYRADGIHSFELRKPDGAPLPPFRAGAHIDVQLRNGLVRAYSLHNDPIETYRYEIAVQREEAGRGGSRFLHETTRVGDMLTISEPANHFPLAEDAARHILIGGGIGVTPLIAMAYRLNAIRADFTLHYCGRARDRLAFLPEAQALIDTSRLTLHLDDGEPDKGLEPVGLFLTPKSGTHVYCCGPIGLNAAVRAATAHWTAGTVHFENFAPPILAAVTTGSYAEFEIEIESSGEIIPVMPNESVLDALRGRGRALDSSCEAGTCGMCRTGLLGGEADHRDFVLTDDEHRDWMMICVSRARSRRLKLAI